MTDPEWIDVEITVTRRLRIAKGTEKSILDSCGQALASVGGYMHEWNTYSFHRATCLDDPPVKASLREIPPLGTPHLS